MLGRSKKGKRKMTRVFFATDFHGSTDCFRKFINVGKEYSCDCLVVGGDIGGKMVVPIVEQHDGSYDATFLGTHQMLRDREAAAKLEELITRSGGYPYLTNVDEMRRLQGSDTRDQEIGEIMRDLMMERLREWMRFAEERLRDSDVKVYICAGNDDPFDLDDVLCDSDVVIHHDGRVVRLDEHHEMIGLGYGNITPWNCPRDVEEDELGRRIDELAAGVEDVPNSVFCIHVPPMNSQLDTCYKLDATVSPPAVVMDGSGQPVEFGAGSVAVLEALQKHQPLVGLHGHIHESRGRVKIGRTEAFNPGSEYGEGLLRGVIVNLAEDRVLSYQFTSG